MLTVKSNELLSCEGMYNSVVIRFVGGQDCYSSHQSATKGGWAAKVLFEVEGVAYCMAYSQLTQYYTCSCALVG